jgi:CubicO group peptidase (beta-lactamase class C family)
MTPSILRALACVSALLAIAYSTISGAYNIDQQAFADLVDERLQAHGVPGAYVVVTLNGEPVFEHRHGHSQLHGDKPFDATTRARLASATKLLSGLTFLSMAEDGLLDLEATLGELDPALPEAFHSLPVWRVLNHTSGLPMLVVREDFNLMTAEQQAGLTAESIAAMLAEQAVDFAPGEAWRYQQAGYSLLARALEKRTGRSFFQLVEERVLHPAGMHDTVFPDADDVSPAYRGDKDALEWQAAPYFTALAPAGGFESTGHDLVKLMRSLQQGEIVSLDFLQQQVLMKGRLYQRRGEVDGEGYGLATIVQRFGNATTLGHSGGGGLADIRLAPDQGIGVVVLTNRSGGTGVASEITEALSEALFGPAHRATE